jgi:hypothetical protein
VPIAICGAEELYRGKRLRVDILPATSAQELLGEAWQSTLEPGTRDELRAARALTTALSARIAEALAEAYPGTVDPPTVERHWIGLTRLLR